MYRKLTCCRACGFGKPQIPTLKESVAAGPQGSGPEHLVPVFDLGLQPLANAFVKSGEEESGFAPLEVLLCPRCNLAQLSVVVRPEILYRRYLYLTSDSQTMRNHFDLLNGLIGSQTKGRKLLEIGSNDGLLMEYFELYGWQPFGMDPAENLCHKAHERGLTVYNDFFGANAAARIQELDPDVILARHVFCHCEDWKDFVRGLEILSKPETLVCIEVPYVQDLLSKGEFDTIYHEHLSYLSIKPLSYLLADTCLRLHKIVPLTIHGGALLIMLRHKDSQEAPDKSVSQFLNSEDFGEEVWKKFAAGCHGKIGALQAFVDHAVTNGKRVCAYGASAKSTVWINAAEFGQKQVAFVTDTTPEKQYCTVPGSNIPVVDPGALLRELPDYAICFAWNYMEEIVRKEQAYLSKGGKFIVPHPDIKVIP